MWSEHELRSVRLGDRRLNRRLAILVEALAARPEASVPQATGSWAAAKAAYRFWDNDRVSPEAILAAHRDSVRDRLPEIGPILAIQDTTALDWTTHPATSGLGYLANRRKVGLLAHSVLAADLDGVPLGLLHQHVWARAPEGLGHRALRNKLPTKAKETQRWIEALSATEAALPPGTLVVTVADREADFYDLFATPRRDGSHLLIRAKPRRRVRHAEKLLDRALRTEPARGSFDVEIRRGPGRPARVASLTARFAAVSLAPPLTRRIGERLADLRVTAILAEEESPPGGEEPIRWWLLTTLPVTTLAEAQRMVLWYSRRWLIERYHSVLKSGCQVERLQLEDASRLRRALATYAVVAWRLLWLTCRARQAPEDACDTVIAEASWQVLHRAVERSEPPERAPGLRVAVRQLARLGGFLGRARDGEPGVTTLWRGLRRLDDLTLGWNLAEQASRASPPTCG
ncbi:IS4 family transposase [Tautonia rosea]|uniref:IS4 family transposase n=1 Tax=Tautonia rosea TaxID=2728037 RepID=UPI0014740960|nr:IS4 family transposase [Tautonia rosea]